MKVFALILLAIPLAANAQVGGGVAAFGGSNQSSALSNEISKRGNRNPTPPRPGTTFLDASVLFNRKADEYVAVFGISQEGSDIKDARTKIDAIIGPFTKKLATFGIKQSDLYVDFVSQNRVYGFKIEADVAREEVVGFEVKKNISIHYKNPAMLDRLTEAASEAGIYDLIKVDYLVKDIKAIQKQLMAEASQIIKDKLANRARLLGTKAPTDTQVYVEDYASYYPTESYSNYIAQESESMSGYRQNMVTIQARKNRTAYFDALGQGTFDKVVNPVVTEPVVQFTLYLRVLVSSGNASKSKK